MFVFNQLLPIKNVIVFGECVAPSVSLFSSCWLLLSFNDPAAMFWEGEGRRKKTSHSEKPARKILSRGNVPIYKSSGMEEGGRRGGKREKEKNEKHNKTASSCLCSPFHAFLGKIQPFGKANRVTKDIETFAERKQRCPEKFEHPVLIFRLRNHANTGVLLYIRPALLLFRLTQQEKRRKRKKHHHENSQGGKEERREKEAK